MDKIIFISPNVKKDGAEKSLVALQVYLNNVVGIKTLVVIPEHGSIEELFKKNNVEYIIHHFVGSVNAGRGTKILRGMAKLSINILLALQLVWKIKKLQVNVIAVHSNTITTDFGHYLSYWLKIPHIWHIREFGKLDFNFDFELGIKYMSQITNKASKIICNSNAVRKYYSQYFDNNKLVTVHNGIKPSSYGKQSNKKDVFKILLIGRLSKEKGQEEAILACHTLLHSGRNLFQLDLFGTGQDIDYLKELIESLGLQTRIFLKGYSNRINIHEYNVGLMCSPYEAFGRVTVEYMFGGIPVIGVNAGGTPEIIDRETGILYNSGDINSLYQAMITLYDKRDLCDEMGKKGIERGKTFFSESHYCENILKVYQEVIQF